MLRDRYDLTLQIHPVWWRARRIREAWLRRNGESQFHFGAWRMKLLITEAMPATWDEARQRAMAGRPVAHGPAPDVLIKETLDGLIPAFFRRRSQFTEVFLLRIWGGRDMVKLVVEKWRETEGLEAQQLTEDEKKFLEAAIDFAAALEYKCGRMGKRHGSDSEGNLPANP